MKRLLFIILFIPILLGGCDHEKDKVFSSIEDVSQGTIGVLLGSSQDHYITEHYKDARILRIDISTDLATALNAGSCDVAIFDQSEAMELIKAHPNFGILQKELFNTSYGIGFNPQTPELRQAFNRFLEEIKGNGVYEQMKQRWTGDLEQIEMPEIPLPDQGAPLRVGTTGMSIPFSFISHGEYIGFDIELTRRFAAYLKRPLKLELMNFGGLIPALSSRKVDLIANNIMITPEREKEIDFSDIYFETPSAVVTTRQHLSPEPNASDSFPQTAQPAKRSLSDFAGKKVGVMMGSTHDAYISQRHPDIDIMRIETEADLLLALQGERCDAVLMDNVSFKTAQKRYKNMAILEEAVYTETSGVGFNYDNTGLRDQFDSFLKEIQNNGLYDEIYERWITHTEIAKMPQLQLPKEGKALKIAITGTSMPFSFMKNGQLVGFDVELLSRFAEKINRPARFETINFGGLIAALSAGKVDIISAAITINEERAKSVAFSEPYFLSKATLASLAVPTASQANARQKNLIERTKDSFYNNLIAEKRYMLILDGLGVTLLISVLASLSGTLLGAGICFLRMSRNKCSRMLGKGYISLMRGTPVLVLLMLMYYVVFAPFEISATTVAIITFACNFAGYVSEMFRSSIEGIDKGQREAGIALGFTKVQTFIHIIMPQAIRNVLPVYKGELISLVKTTSIVGYIAVIDLTKASDIIRSRTFDAFFPLIMVAVIYFVIAWIFASLLDYYKNTKLARK